MMDKAKALCRHALDGTSLCILEILGAVAISVSIYLVAFGSWVWAQDRLTHVDIVEMSQEREIARIAANQVHIDRRVTAIEDRLFGIFMMTAGTTLAAGISAVFTIRTHRRVRNNGAVAK